ANIKERVQKLTRGGKVEIRIVLQNPSVVFPTAYSADNANYLVVKLKTADIRLETCPDRATESIDMMAKRMC
ncbi:unnamed protein product, partial [Amoebophrya sp. A25]